MNTTLATSDITQRRAGVTRRPRSTPAVPAPLGAPRPNDAGELLGKRPASELTRLVFCAILGISAVVALIGVLNQASATSPDAPAPSVIVDFD